MFRGKKYKESAKQIDKTMLYDVADGMALICKTASAKFDETVELHVKLGVDSRHADQQVRGAIVLAPRHRQDRPGPGVRQGRQGRRCPGGRRGLRGRDGYGGEDPEGKLVRLRRGCCQPRHDGPGGRLGKVLGPKGLMPSPRPAPSPPTWPRPCRRSRPVRSSTAWTRPTSSTAPSARCPSAREAD